MDKLNKFKLSLTKISTKDITTNYNDGRIIGARDLPTLARIYKESSKTIIVMFAKRKTKPDQPPKWFRDFALKQEKFNKAILSRLDNIENRLDNLETRLDNLVTKNHLVE